MSRFHIVVMGTGTVVLLGLCSSSARAQGFNPFETGQDKAAQVVQELLTVETATKREQTIAEAPAIISVITDRQIKQRGYRSVAEALDSLPGLYGISDNVQWNFGVRGINGGARAGSRIFKVMIDGQPIAFRPTTENWLGEELIPIGAVRRIEIIRGPSSALYGANAFLGVINVITTNGATVDGARVGGSFGLTRSHPGGGGQMVVGTKSGTLDVMVAASGMYTDRSGITIQNVPNRTTNYPAPGNQSLNDTAVPASLFFKLLHTNKTFGNISLDVSYQRLNAAAEFADWGPLAQGSQRGLTFIDSDLRNQVSLQNLTARARLARTFADDFNFNISGAFAMMGPTDLDRLSLASKGLADWVKRDFGTTSIDLVSELSYTAKQINTFTLGVDFTLDHHQLLNYYYWQRASGGLSATTKPDARGSDDFDNVGVYLQSVMYPFQLFGLDKPLLNTFGLTLGLRYDHHNIYGDAVNYRVGAVYLWNKLSAKVLFGSSFKAPAAVQLYTMLLQPGDVLANPDLKAEKAKTLEVQVGREIVKGLTAEATFFYSMVDDKVEIVNDLVSSNTVAKNIGSIKSLGVEADLGYQWSGLTSFLNFTYQKTTQKTGTATTDTDVALFPSVMLKLGVGYQIPRIYLGAFAEGRLITSRLSSSPNAKAYDPINEKPYSLPTYFTFDLSLSTVDLKLLPGGRETFLQAKLYNVAGSEVLYPGFRNFDIPSLGRTLFITLTQQL